MCGARSHAQVLAGHNGPRGSASCLWAGRARFSKLRHGAQRALPQSYIGKFHMDLRGARRAPPQNGNGKCYTDWRGQAGVGGVLEQAAGPEEPASESDSSGTCPAPSGPALALACPAPTLSNMSALKA
eukprot:287242-Alexandrium_andersonii.AAC.1